MQIVKAQDREIIRMLKNQDQQVISLILVLYGDQLYGFIFHYLQSEELAVEAMKKVFVNIWEYSSTYNKAPEHFFVWLLKIVKQTIEEDYLID